MASAEIIEFEDAAVAPAAGSSRAGSESAFVKLGRSAALRLESLDPEFFRGWLRSTDRHNIKAPKPIRTTGQKSRNDTRNMPNVPVRKSPPITTQKIPELRA